MTLASDNPTDGSGPIPVGDAPDGDVTPQSELTEAEETAPIDLTNAAAHADGAGGETAPSNPPTAATGSVEPEGVKPAGTSDVALAPERPSGAETLASLRAPRLAEGVELIGEYDGSGFKEPPSLVRRLDGQVIQLPTLLYSVLAHCDGETGYGQIAAAVGEEIQRGLDAEQVKFLVENKLRPLGVLAMADGSEPDIEKPDPFLALKFRMGVISEKHSDAVGTLFKPLFFGPIVLAVLGGFVAADVWLFADHGVAQALRQSIEHPGLFLALFLGVTLAAAFHEIGHAAGCRYGGGHPGKMGCGLYLAWPAFYTDVTDAYRLGRRARLRTDLGGVYFNVVVVLATVGAYLATGFEPLLLLVIIQHVEIAHQLLPVIRLDGYYIVSDLTGVPDLFARIGPILRSAIPWHKSEAEVKVLKPWVRAAVTAWVLIVVPLLIFELLTILIHLPRLLATAWDSGVKLIHATGQDFGNGDYLGTVSSVVQVVVLAIPVIGILLMLFKAANGIGRWLLGHTEGRPIHRVGGLGLAAAAVTALAFAWIPKDNYTPIQPGERGTIAEGVAAVRRLPTGEAPLYVRQVAERHAATTTTTPATTSTTVDPAKETTSTTTRESTNTTEQTNPSTTTTSSSATSTTASSSRTPATTSSSTSPTTTSSSRTPATTSSSTSSTTTSSSIGSTTAPTTTTTTAGP